MCAREKIAQDWKNCPNLIQKVCKKGSFSWVKVVNWFFLLELKKYFLCCECENLYVHKDAKQNYFKWP